MFYVVTKHSTGRVENLSFSVSFPNKEFLNSFIPVGVDDELFEQAVEKVIVDQGIQIGYHVIAREDNTHYGIYTFSEIQFVRDHFHWNSFPTEASEDTPGMREMTNLTEDESDIFDDFDLDEEPESVSDTIEADNQW